MDTDNLKGFGLVVESSAFIGSNFIIKKKALQRAGASGSRAKSKMLLAVVICYPTGARLFERFNGISDEEQMHWLSLLEKLGADNLQGVKNKELLFSCYKSVCITGTVFGNFHIFAMSKDENDRPSLAKAIFYVISSFEEVYGKPPFEHVFDKVGKLTLYLDRILSEVYGGCREFKRCYKFYHPNIDLIRDIFDLKNYKMTRKKFSRRGFGFHIDSNSNSEDNNDKLSFDVETSDGPVRGRSTSGMDISSRHIGEKRKSGRQMEKGKKNKCRAKELFFSDDHLASVSEDLDSSHNHSSKSDDLPSVTECILELEETGKLKRQSSLHLFAISFLTLRKNRAGFVACQDAGTKFKWILFNFTNWSKCKSPLP